jgi:hypothetical protein
MWTGAQWGKVMGDPSDEAEAAVLLPPITGGGSY